MHSCLATGNPLLRKCQGECLDVSIALHVQDQQDGNQHHGPDALPASTERAQGRERSQFAAVGVWCTQDAIAYRTNLGCFRCSPKAEQMQGPLSKWASLPSSFPLAEPKTSNLDPNAPAPAVRPGARGSVRVRLHNTQLRGRLPSKACSSRLRLLAIAEYRMLRARCK